MINPKISSGKKRTVFFAVLALMVMACFTAYASQPLAGFEGYYQLDNDKDFYLQIMVKNNKLVLKQLWDEREIPFEQKSDLKFYNDQESFPLTFSKNANGEITQLLAFERDTWIKLKGKPAEKKEINLTAEKMQAFAGKYKLSHDGDDAFIQFTVNGNSLEAKELWSGKTYIIVPQTELVFFGRKAYYPVQFSKDNDGNVTQALIFNKDVWVKVKE
ncbi:MAG TPA: hypothetical protein VK772_00065 [Puia sp.]|nr:hypothetical protein [Puia sp.]